MPATLPRPILREPKIRPLHPHIKRKRFGVRLIFLALVLSACALLIYYDFLRSKETAPVSAPESTPPEGVTAKRVDVFKALLEELPPDSWEVVLEGLKPSAREALFISMPAEKRAEIFSALSPEFRDELLPTLPAGILPTPTPVETPAPVKTQPPTSSAGQGGAPKSGARPPGELEGVFAKDGRKIAYLTFDDGPSPHGSTEKILEILREKGVKATFFMPGYMAEASPHLVKLVHDEGHVVANHSYSHVYDKIYASGESFISEVERTNELFKSIIGDGYKTRLFRFPGGSSGGKYNDVKEKYRLLLYKRGYRYIDWNALTGDSERKKRTPDEFFDYFVQTAGNKEKIVVLMHDAPDENGATVVLPRVIEYLRERGYEFGRLEYAPE